MAQFETWERETLNQFAREATKKLLKNEAEIERLKEMLHFNQIRINDLVIQNNKLYDDLIQHTQPEPPLAA